VLGGETGNRADAPWRGSPNIFERQLFAMLVINGAAGNLSPIYTVYPDSSKSGLQLANSSRVLPPLGQDFEANRNIGPRPRCRLILGEQYISRQEEPELGGTPNFRLQQQGHQHGETVGCSLFDFYESPRDIAHRAAPSSHCSVRSPWAVRSPFSRSPYTFFIFSVTATGWLGYFPRGKEFAMGGYEPPFAFTEAGRRGLGPWPWVSYLQRSEVAKSGALDGH